MNLADRDDGGWMGGRKASDERLESGELTTHEVMMKSVASKKSLSLTDECLTND